MHDGRLKTLCIMDAKDSTRLPGGGKTDEFPRGPVPGRTHGARAELTGVTES